MTVFLVAISAGHNPEAKGATASNKHIDGKPISEYDVTVPWAAELLRQIAEVETVEHLYLRGMEVKTGKLGYKVEQINKAKADLAIEIHFNAGAKTNGVETLFAPDSKNGLNCAKVIHEHYAHVMDNKNRGIKEGWYKMDQPGRVDYEGDVDGDEKPDYFLAKTRMTALILEPEFMYSITNAQDKMVEACAGLVVAINELALRKHYEHNLPPREKENVG
jgi:hypothetical protein